MSKVWVTRSQPGAARSAKRLSSLGYDPFEFPLLEIAPPKITPPTLPENAILIITSQNGLLALPQRTASRRHSVVTVGDATAELARNIGFGDVVSANGTAQDVVAMVRKNFTQDTRPFIHISGEITRGDIVGEIKESGFNAQRHIYYVSRPVAKTFETALNKFDFILLYSPMAARVLRVWGEDMAEASFISISKETDAALGNIIGNRRLIAADPTENSMFSLLD